MFSHPRGSVYPKFVWVGNKVEDLEFYDVSHLTSTRPKLDASESAHTHLDRVAKETKIKIPGPRGSLWNYDDSLQRIAVAKGFTHAARHESIPVYVPNTSKIYKMKTYDIYMVYVSEPSHILDFAAQTYSIDALVEQQNRERRAKGSGAYEKQIALYVDTVQDYPAGFDEIYGCKDKGKVYAVAIALVRYVSADPRQRQAISFYSNKAPSTEEVAPLHLLVNAPSMPARRVRNTDRRFDTPLLNAEVMGMIGRCSAMAVLKLQKKDKYAGVVIGSELKLHDVETYDPRPTMFTWTLPRARINAKYKIQKLKFWDLRYNYLKGNINDWSSRRDVHRELGLFRETGEQENGDIDGFLTRADITHISSAINDLDHRSARWSDGVDVFDNESRWAYRVAKRGSSSLETDTFVAYIRYEAKNKGRELLRFVDYVLRQPSCKGSAGCFTQVELLTIPNTYPEWATHFPYAFAQSLAGQRFLGPAGARAARAPDGHALAIARLVLTPYGQNAKPPVKAIYFFGQRVTQGELDSDPTMAASLNPDQLPLAKSPSSSSGVVTSSNSPAAAMSAPSSLPQSRPTQPTPGTAPRATSSRPRHSHTSNSRSPVAAAAQGDEYDPTAWNVLDPQQEAARRAERANYEAMLRDIDREGFTGYNAGVRPRGFDTAPAASTSSSGNVVASQYTGTGYYPQGQTQQQLQSQSQAQPGYSTGTRTIAGMEVSVSNYGSLASPGRGQPQGQQQQQYGSPGQGGQQRRQPQSAYGTSTGLNVSVPGSRGTSAAAAGQGAQPGKRTRNTPSSPSSGGNSPDRQDPGGRLRSATTGKPAKKDLKAYTSPGQQYAATTTARSPSVGVGVRPGPGSSPLMPAAAGSGARVGRPGSAHPGSVPPSDASRHRSSSRHGSVPPGPGSRTSARQGSVPPPGGSSRSSSRARAAAGSPGAAAGPWSPGQAPEYSFGYPTDWELQEQAFGQEHLWNTLNTPPGGWPTHPGTPK